MAQIEFEFPVSSYAGRVSKKEKGSPVMRQKCYRDANGRVVAKAAKEAYVVTTPRDYKKHPMKGTELANVNLFRQSVLLAKQERDNPERLAYWTERWQAQLERGEFDAPIDSATRQPKIYRRLDIFIQSVIQRQLKNVNANR